MNSRLFKRYSYRFNFFQNLIFIFIIIVLSKFILIQVIFPSSYQDSITKKTITLIINPPTHGCMDSSACNYDPDADIDDGVCLQLDECNNCGGNAYAAICASGFPTSITDYTGWTDFWEELVSSAQAITAGCEITKADWGSCGAPTSYCNTK